MCTLCSNIPGAPSCIGVPGETLNAPGTALDQTGLPGGIAASGLGPASETGDAGDTTATAGILDTGISLYGTIETPEDNDWYAIDLTAGQAYEFRLHGFGDDGIFDSLLRVRDANGTILSVNDDADPTVYDGSGARDPWIGFTAQTSGTYYIEAASSNFYSGDYILTAVKANDAGMDFTLDEIAWQLINHDGYPSPFDAGTDGRISVDITALTTDGQALARAALQQWSDLTGLAFVEVDTGGEITFDDSETGLAAYTRSQYTSVNGAWYLSHADIMVTEDWINTYGTGFNTYSYQTYIHEIGHALGLYHSGNYNGSASYGTDNFYLNDSHVYTIMSYFSPYENSYVGGTFYDMLTPMLADAIAAEAFYGRSTDTRTGDTTYGFNANTGDTALDLAASFDRTSFMVHDDGGIDTIDMSGEYRAQTIDLRDGSLSSVLGGTYNMAISRGTVIENAIGGTGADMIQGNAAANTLSGGAGDDTIDGGAGADVLDGGDGIDTLSYASSSGQVYVALNGAAAAIVLRGDAQGDTATGFENVIGSSFNDALFGDAGANSVDGGDGNDLIEGGAGADTLTGGAGIDTLSYAGSASGVTVTLNSQTAATGGDAQGDTSSGFENLTGSALSDSLTGDDGDNVIEGGAGADTLTGGGGADTLSYAGSGAAVDVRLYGAGEAIVSGGDAAGDTATGFENVTGSALSDTLTGDWRANVIDGGAGDDTILDGGGNDTLSGGAGNDTIEGGRGADTLDGGDGTDTLSYSRSRAGVDVVLNGAASGGDAQGDTVSGFENIAGSRFADRLTGDDGANVIDGSDGDDMIEGGAGADTLIGGNGADTLSYAGSSAAVDVRLYGYSKVFASGGDAEGDTATWFENLTGSAHGDTLTGDWRANVIDGGAGDDTILDGGGNDTLSGGAGNDTIEGGAGADVLDGGDGMDTLSYSGSSAGVSVRLNGAAAATVSGGDAQADTATGFENVTGSALSDTLTGDDGANTIDGSYGDDVIQGGAGADTLDGGGGTDTLSYAGSSAAVDVRLYGYSKIFASGGDAEGDTATGFENLTGSAHGDTLTGDWRANVIDGGDGDDTIIDGGGNDTLIGGAGNDVLSGGAGDDLFVFAEGFGQDRITDFDASSAGERIDLSGVSAITDFADLQGMMSQSGTDVLIDAGGGDTITLAHVALADLDASDFVF
ncbi:MAG: M10 family metallopeptidase C-terminal domain-containing protein [Brucellaceae bacterium]|nr:M10 family metallopeptidase C-terminal domain-containing protein [Brucellaceae bacterium]